MSEKFVPPAQGPLERIAGPHTTIDKEEADKGMPSVFATPLGYALPARNDGNIYARPFLCTSVDSRNQHVSGYVYWEPEDRVPNPGQNRMLAVGPYSAFVRDIPMDNPSVPNSVHWLASNYTGRSDGPQPVPVGSSEVVQEVPADAAPSNTQPLEPPANPADRNKDGVVTPKEQRQYDREHEHEKP